MAALFDPLIEVAGRSPKNKLYTQKIPKERQSEQFKRFREIEVDSTHAVPLPNGGFLAKLKENDYEFLVFSAPGLNSPEVRNLEDALTGVEEFHQVEFDETMFLFCCFELKGLLNLRLKYRNPELADDILGLADAESYSGHSIYDLRDYFNPVYAFRVDANNKRCGANITEYALTLLVHQPNLRSPIVDRHAGDRISALMGKTACGTDNLFQALTSSQWKYVFLDLYRCLESLYFFPWIRELKGALDSEENVYSLRESSWSALGWSPKEDNSIKKLFELVDDKVFQDDASEVDKFSSLKPDSSPPSSYAERLYSVRNTMVHHADRQGRSPNPASAADYRQLCLFLCAVLEAIHRDYSAELS
ncbi:hypothetical protein [Roseivivax isoporae]|uniref:hypothetical protein n=1 Tax=Roseivivax isoporae TaxID=591206 RepID=UPI0012EBAB34|nr:hypothetical protein [Roseivivax isoporae]